MRTVKTGSASRKNYAGIVCLDPKTMTGEAPPRHGSLKKGTELWYALVLPQGVTIQSVTLRPPSPSAAPGSAGQTFQVQTIRGAFLYLDDDGNVVGRGVGDTASDTKDVRIELMPNTR